MNDRVITALSRRASVLTLGALGASVALAPVASSARNRKNKKVKKKARQKCQQQVDQCNDFVIVECNGQADCIAEGQVCCSSLAECDLTGFLNCLA